MTENQPPEPADILLALYPPEIEPDWETLDLDDERWFSWQFMKFWPEPRGIWERPVQ